MKEIFCLSLILLIVWGNETVRDFQIKTPLTTQYDTQNQKHCVIEIAKEHPFFNFDPLIVSYKPPSLCGPSSRWSFISVNITATVNGTQYDRLGLLFLNDIEIWRTSSSEPTKAGIVWSTLKDVTRYRSLFGKEGKVVFHMGNEVFGPYTGIFRVSIQFTFHPQKEKEDNNYADQILGITKKGTGNDSDVFSVGANGFSNPSFTMLSIPSNTKEAWVEIFASGNGNEEFWYTNVPDAYAKNYSAIGRGPFREIQLLLDGRLVGSVFPCPVIFTGGINPLLWRPSHSFGALDQPTYYIDLSPHLFLLSDSLPHNFTLTVAGMGSSFSINDNWYLSANLQLKLAQCSERTTGKMIHYSVGPAFLSPLLIPSFLSNGSVALLKITASRIIDIQSLIQTCEGKVKTNFHQKLRYENVMTLSNGGNDQTVSQKTFVEASSLHNDKIVYQESSSFPLVVNTTLQNEGQIQILTSIVNRLFGKISVDPLQQSKKGILVDQESSGDFKMKNNIGFEGHGNQTLFFSYKDTKGFTYERQLSITKNLLISDKEFGTLKGFPSGFSPELIDGPDSPHFHLLSVRSPRLVKN